MTTAPLSAPAGVVRSRAAVAQSRWDSFGQVARCQGAPEVTTTEPVGSWVESIPAGLTERSGWHVPEERAARLCGRGVAVADVHSYARGRMGSGLPHAMVSGLVEYGLTGMASAAPGCPVQDAVGWLLALPGLGKTLMPGTVMRPVHVDTATVVAQSWFAAGFEFGDYVYPAAGLTIAEALAGLRAGTVDRDRALVLAALRGALLPAR